jgi:phosphate uptake regulator
LGKQRIIFVEKDTRIIQETGANSYTISLLPNWAEENAGAGSEVTQYRLGNSVVLSPVSEASQNNRNSGEIDVSEFHPSKIPVLVKNLYVSGMDEVRVKAPEDSEKCRKKVREATKYLTGMTVVSETEEEVILKNFMDNINDSLTDSIQRMSQLSVDAVEKTFLTSFEEDLSLETKLNEFDRKRNYFKRNLTEIVANPHRLINTDFSLSDVFFAELFVTEISYVIEDAGRISRSSGTVNKDIGKDRFVEMKQNAVNTLESATEAYMQTTNQKTSEAYNNRFTRCGYGEEPTETGTKPGDELSAFLRLTAERGEKIARIAERKRAVDGQQRVW